MALNVPVFLTRLGSAIVFGIIMIVGMNWNHYSFFTLFFVINIICLVEYGSIVEKIMQTTFSKIEKMSYYFVGVATFLTVSAIAIKNTDDQFIANIQHLLFFFGGLLLGSLILFFFFNKNKKAYYLLTGVGYIALAFGLYIQTRFLISLLPFVTLLLIWSNDTFAYLVGSFVGKTKYVPNISPNKTLEGTIGGIIITILLGLYLKHVFQYYDTIHYVMIALIVGITGTIGDLIESKLKRMANIKDSGNIMPGHGGAFDRFDSLIFVIPFVFLYCILFLPH